MKLFKRILFLYLASFTHDSLQAENVLHTFDAKAQQVSVQLEWAATEEHNAWYFLIERSSDGILFETAGQVSAMGSATSQNHYRFSDITPREGQNYYRLLLVDHNGVHEALGLTSVEYHSSPTLVVYPNPSAVGETVAIVVGEPQAMVEVYDQKGSVVFSVACGDPGKREVIADQLPPGIYLVKMRCKSTAKSCLLVVK